jgi:hypothetical protein
VDRPAPIAKYKQQRPEMGRGDDEFSSSFNFHPVLTGSFHFVFCWSLQSERSGNLINRSREE